MTPNSPRKRSLTIAVVLAVLATLAVPSAAPAQSGGTNAGQAQTPLAPAARPEVGIEDENIIFGASAPLVVARWRSMGADSVRIQAYWDALSPDSSNPNRPGNFDPSNPNDPQYQFGPLDRAINLVRNNGMRVNLTLNQCGPRWASLDPGNATHCWRPSPQIFGQFVGAVAKRYRGQIARFLDGSEANQTQFLAPQFTCTPRCRPDSPHQYRNLLNASVPVLKANAPGVPVIIGEMAPIGSPPSRTGGMKPLTFLRELGCVTRRFRKIRTGSCRGFKAPRGDGFGYHPYVNNRKAPTVPNRDPDIAKIGDIPRLLRTIDRLSTSGRIRPFRGRRFPVFFTEYGYISNPPSPKFGVSLARQAAYNAESSYIVWKRRSRIKLLSQYLFMDDQTFGTGLVQRNGVAKPSLGAFPHPFWIDGRRRRARFWGQARPDSSRTVVLQVKARGSRTYKNVRKFRTDPGGYWTGVMSARRGATYRFQYFPRGAPAAFSITIPAPRR